MSCALCHKHGHIYAECATFNHKEIVVRFTFDSTNYVFVSESCFRTVSVGGLVYALAEATKFPPYALDLTTNGEYLNPTALLHFYGITPGTLVFANVRQTTVPGGIDFALHYPKPVDVRLETNVGDGRSNRCVCIRRLPAGTTREDIAAAAHRYGPATHVSVHMPPGKPRGFAFIQFQEKSSFDSFLKAGAQRPTGWLFGTRADREVTAVEARRPPRGCNTTSTLAHVMRLDTNFLSDTDSVGTLTLHGDEHTIMYDGEEGEDHSTRDSHRRMVDACVGADTEFETK